MIDRDFQNFVLKTLAEHYPNSADVNRVFESQTDKKLLFNLKYLEQHNLINVKWVRMQKELYASHAEILASGLDFLADDGGLSAILGVVVVRLDDSTIRQLIVQRVFEADVEPSVKSRIIDSINGLSAEGIKAVTMRTLEIGLNNVPQLVQALRGMLNI